MHDLTRAKQRLKSLLLRQGYRYSGKANWSAAHQRYLRELVLPLPALKAVLEECLLAIKQTTERVGRLDDLLGRGVMKAKVTVALARELAGFTWALLGQVPAPASTEPQPAPTSG